MQYKIVNCYKKSFLHIKNIFTTFALYLSNSYKNKMENTFVIISYCLLKMYVYQFCNNYICINNI